MSFPPESLEFSRLGNLRQHASGKVTARCPACAEVERDRKGNHLVIYPGGKYGCVAAPGDKIHNRRIFALAGMATGVPETCMRSYRQQRILQKHRELEARRLTETVRQCRQALVERYAWSGEDVWDDSPQRIDGDFAERCPRHFFTSLFHPDSIIWAGDVHESGQPHHSRNWKSCGEWTTIRGRIGPMTSPAIWKPGTCSRSAGNVISSPYTVLDFDGFDGIKPSTPAELERHLRDSLAIIRWLRDFFRWELAAILHTGGKSLHAWFHAPPDDILQSLKTPAGGLGIDSGLIGRPEHPCRLPGQIHHVTGRISRVLWLQSPYP
jgi:hypothetical protein